MKRSVILGGLLAAGFAAQAGAEAPGAEQMWALIQQQQAEIDALKRRLAAADNRIEETVVKVEATADRLEQAAPESGTIAASTPAAWTANTHLGGYGEVHYNTLDNDNGNDQNLIDAHRMVLLVGHQFSERTRFYAELELEHAIASSEDEGEYELEQMFVEHDLAGSHRVKAGVFLVPVGILNETHEPDTFYGVERNNVEHDIIPSTWFEPGVAVNGEIAPGLAYDVALTSGLSLDPGEGQWEIREGRQEAMEANASDPGVTTRIKYTGIAGLELAATVQYQRDLYQGKLSDEVDAWLFETHLAWQHGPFGLRALYADWNIDEGITVFAAGADEQRGWYVEPSWRFTPKIGVFARYSEWDKQAGADLGTDYAQWDLGLNYWLEPNVVFKLDYQSQDAPAGEDQLDGLNLGVGVSF